MLIDKDLRLSISGCFWLFYASKYKCRKTANDFYAVVKIEKRCRESTI